METVRAFLACVVRQILTVCVKRFYADGTIICWICSFAIIIPQLWRPDEDIRGKFLTRAADFASQQLQILLGNIRILAIVDI